jgi:hypothetical protein
MFDRGIVNQSFIVERYSMISPKPGVFISYAHKDGMEFTRRLAFALSLYMDVFWDRRLQAGEYPPQLYKEIEARDFILLVMSPYSLNSVWCLDECDYAVRHGKKVVLARIYDDCHCDLEKELADKYTYGPFNEDFEAGFRRITQMMLGHPVSSWEYASNISDDTELLYMLDHGTIPSLISQNLAHWIISEKLWKSMEKEPALDHFIIQHGTPCTPAGLIRQCNNLLQQFEFMNNAPGFIMAKQAVEIVHDFVNAFAIVHKEDHLATGQAVAKIGRDVYDYLLLRTELANSVDQFLRVQGYYHFDVAEKLRELVFLHANRSRHLY